MNFVSAPFLVLLAITFSVYYLPWWNAPWQIAILIVSSLVFYSWTQPYLVSLLLLSAFITSFASYWIAREECAWKRKATAIVGVASMLIILGFFKYDRLIYSSFVGEYAEAPDVARWILELPLP